MEDKHPEDAAVTRNEASDVEVHGMLIQARDVRIRLAEPDPVPDIPVIVTWRWLTHDSVGVGDDEDEQESLMSGAPALEILVEGRSAQAAVLKELRPVVLSRRPPRQIRSAIVNAGILEVRPFEVDLDPEVPELRSLGADFPFKVSRDDPEEFRVTCTSSRDEVRWRLELRWVCAGRSGSVQIPEEGSFGVYPSLHRCQPRAEFDLSVDPVPGDPMADRSLAEALMGLVSASGCSVAEIIDLGRHHLRPPAVFAGQALLDWLEGRSVPSDADLFQRLVCLLEAAASRRDPCYRGRGAGWWEDMRRVAEGGDRH
ncbi:hypothetical protein [Kitasatospora sp. NPDC051705]|uniref:hypothetical protein n=1 Tax=Kitasatospora sp. NPDC051705 TaxID=3364057 RepID=UPI0037B89EB3